MNGNWVVSADTTNKVFKTRLDKYWHNPGYYL